MSFSEGMYAGMALGDRIKDNLGRKGREAKEQAAQAQRENMLFSSLSPEQRQVYLDGQTPEAGSPGAALFAKRKQGLDAVMEERRSAMDEDLAGKRKIDQAAEAERGEAKSRQENEMFARMSPDQQLAYVKQQGAPVGIGVLRPESYNPQQRMFAARSEIARDGQERAAEAQAGERLNATMERMTPRGMSRQPVEPSATVQYGPDGTVQRRWVRGVSPVTGLAGGVGGSVPTAAPAGVPAGSPPEVNTQEAFDQLPKGAPFVFRGQRGVKR